MIIFALGQTRLNENAHADLSALNLPLIRKAATDIMVSYTDAAILVLSQPCEIMTHALLQYTGLPQYKIAGIGTLPQTLHFRRLLGKYLGVNAQHIHASVLGEAEHGILSIDQIFIDGIARICDDGMRRFLVPEVNSGAEDLSSIIEDIIG